MFDDRPQSSISPASTYGTFIVSYGTDIGEKKKNQLAEHVTNQTHPPANEDRVFVTRIIVDRDPTGKYLDKSLHLEETFLLMADGMGGQGYGSMVSSLILQTCKAEYIDARKRGEKIATSLLHAIHEANKVVNDVNIHENKQMASTVALAVLQDDGEYIYAHLGDARAYVIDSVHAVHIGKDHNLTAAIIDAGLLPKEAIYTHRDRNVTTRGIGIEEKIQTDDIITIGRLEDGQHLLLCTDGLWQMTKDSNGETIHNIVLTATDPQSATQALIKAANDAGGEDNISVIIAKKLPTTPHTASSFRYFDDAQTPRDIADAVSVLESLVVKNGTYTKSELLQLINDVAEGKIAPTALPHAAGLREAVERVTTSKTPAPHHKMPEHVRMQSVFDIAVNFSGLVHLLQAAGESFSVGDKIYMTSDIIEQVHAVEKGTKHPDDLPDLPGLRRAANRLTVKSNSPLSQ